MNHFASRFLTKYRGVIILIFVLPASFLMETFFTIRNWLYQTFFANPKLHDQRVKRVQEQVRQWKASGSDKLMCTARGSWLTISTRTATFKEDCNQITVNLRDILDIDAERQVVRTEPLVNMGYITRHLVPQGWALAIQVEMEDLTVGGLCMGVGMETNSHLYGLIQETVVAFEVILADGTLVRATKDENADLFYALPWSHGTLGFLVAVELKIIPVKPYLHLTYIPCYTQKEYCTRMRELAEADDAPAFLEATVYSKDRAMIMTGEFAEVKTRAQRRKINRVNLWFKPWFYKHVEAFFDQGQGDEYIPLRHYYHRHTRSIFWELGDLIPFGNHPVYRWLFGWLGAPKVSFLKLTMTKTVRRKLMFKHVVQDIIIPITEMGQAVSNFDEWFGIYPLLVFPIRIYDHGKYQGFLRKPPYPIPGTSHQMFFDLGVYGIPPAVRRGEPWDARTAIRQMEAYAREVGGYQLLYADTFMTRAEFEEMFDHDLYRRMRKKYGAEGAFPEVYDKVIPEKFLLEDLSGDEQPDAVFLEEELQDQDA